MPLSSLSQNHLGETQVTGDAICLIDTDCEVDFAMSLDYKEPVAKRTEAKKEDDEKKIETVNRGDGKEEMKEFRLLRGRHAAGRGRGCAELRDSGERPRQGCD
ncbi:hypothetical protein BUALT_Bualt05G0013800 [Buddleja alternifolia]|uniref:Uncharacterized protein n=1 Tax=Buddleja alternifolia TaxID=168488 RepID=A0AAV6XNL1_9LAMI|nr:hypothetical protein BUALT_Bualt05G0013800 [Buddleja alternifolia]